MPRAVKKSSAKKVERKIACVNMEPLKEPSRGGQPLVHCVARDLVLGENAEVCQVCDIYREADRSFHDLYRQTAKEYGGEIEEFEEIEDLTEDINEFEEEEEGGEEKYKKKKAAKKAPKTRHRRSRGEDGEEGEEEEEDIEDEDLEEDSEGEEEEGEEEEEAEEGEEEEEEEAEEGEAAVSEEEVVEGEAVGGKSPGKKGKAGPKFINRFAEEGAEGEEAAEGAEEIEELEEPAEVIPEVESEDGLTPSEAEILKRRKLARKEIEGAEEVVETGGKEKEDLGEEEEDSDKEESSEEENSGEEKTAPVQLPAGPGRCPYCHKEFKNLARHQCKRAPK